MSKKYILNVPITKINHPVLVIMTNIFISGKVNSHILMAPIVLIDRKYSTFSYFWGCFYQLTCIRLHGSLAKMVSRVKLFKIWPICFICNHANSAPPQLVLIITSTHSSSVCIIAKYNSYNTSGHSGLPVRPEFSCF